MPTRSRRPLPEERGHDARDELVHGRTEARLLLGLYRGQEKAHRVTTEGLSGTHRGHKIALEPLLQLRAYAPSSASALAALRFLALAACGRPLVELAAAGLREDPGLLDLLVESAKRCLKRLAFTNDYFRQRLLVTPPSFQKETGPAEAGQPNSRWTGTAVKMRMFTGLPSQTAPPS